MCTDQVIQLKQQKERRKFIKQLTIGGLVLNFGFLTACQETLERLSIENEVFTTTQNKNLLNVLNILFPDDGNGPSIHDLNTFHHILWSMKDPYSDGYSKSVLIEGLDKLESSILSSKQKSFFQLSMELQEEEVEKMVKKDWGERFCSMLLSFIFESIAIDEAYAVNTGQVGWKWLQHQPGFPRPTPNDLYPSFIANHQL
ncbi:hypothetical protein DNU06_06450 [Putridiphycobacter roseus]|uniref:Gluconate 2-dehydrogenase subunit 3 family protein n=1 Tax=Putridiphycobacter roseus TaxID=2219161 RepID=A0A2W1N114_9FLAO|nr:gluconate 2-dehydrogenase subunit 3 family protein [Putridiphycobacter roseus]PZE17464.1 hypothetical protein DNU06_06450 [Putridiphycobacter roseus]